MKNAIFSNWNFGRVLRLGLGIFIMVQSVIVKDWTMGIIGAMFTAMPVFNIGCCGSGGCAVPSSTKRDDSSHKDATYEEVV